MIKNGFTLVELLVVIAILSVAGTLVVTIFTSSLRGSNKSQIVSSIKQNGQLVLEIMDKTIRNSDNIVCVSNLQTTLVIVKNGIFTRYRFIAPVGSTNGLIEQDAPVQIFTDPVKADIKLFIDAICADTDPMSEANILTDTNPQTGVSAKNGLFTRSKQAGSKDAVTVKFDLAPASGAPQAVAGQIDPVTFQTTIQLR